VPVPTRQRSRPRWLRLAPGAVLIAVPLLAAIPRWDTLLANNPVYPLTLAFAFALGLVLVVTALTTSEPPQPGRLRRTFRVAATAGAFGLAVVLFWLAPFPASPDALAALESDDAIAITDTRATTTYEPAEPSSAAFVLYPGARVDPRAYAVLARRIAEAGSPVTVLKCPFDLSLVCGDPTPYLPEGESWAIGGHSLGGVSASVFVDRDVPDGAGLIFWASYPLSDLSDRTELAVTSIHATQDQLTTLLDVSLNMPKLPPDTVYVAIKGAVHAFFGDYGEQPGDGEPEISRDDAQNQIVDATVTALQALGNSD
jgi:hypothetical protein